MAAMNELQQLAYANPMRTAEGALPAGLTRREGRLTVGLSANF